MITLKYQVKKNHRLGKELVWYIFFFIPCRLFILRNKNDIFFSQEWSWEEVSCLWRSAHGPIWKLSIMFTTNIWGNSADKGIIHHCHPGLWILRIPENLEQPTLHWQHSCWKFWTVMCIAVLRIFTKQSNPDVPISEHGVHFLQNIHVSPTVLSTSSGDWGVERPASIIHARSTEFRSTCSSWWWWKGRYTWPLCKIWKLHPNGPWKEHGGWSAAHTGKNQWKNSFNKIWNFLLDVLVTL